MTLLHKHLLARALILLSLGLAVACSAGKKSVLDDEGGGAANASSSSSGVGGLFSTGGNGPGGGGPSDGCSEQAKLIYLLSDANDLYSFKPDIKELIKIGPLSCATSMQPNSMAVDRNAVAWVNYVEADIFGDAAPGLFKVSTADASCEPGPIVNLPQGWFRIGMGFSPDGADTNNETLYVPGIGLNGALGRIDFQTNTLVPIGSFTGQFAGQNAELTGTGDARLYGFFTSSPVEVAQINKGDGSIIDNVPLPTVEVPNAWAFSFWGGDFYLYTASIGLSRVNRYRPLDGTVDTNYISDVGFRIVGAGVSTCAPLKPPN